ncbi:MAG: hypothetical protein LBR10_16130 [Prevotellaceae bacterium]|jgi:hypothetical protein|nr:hypothetical protein [Prevotellaceae bacterium]
MRRSGNSKLFVSGEFPVPDLHIAVFDRYIAFADGNVPVPDRNIPFADRNLPSPQARNCRQKRETFPEKREYCPRRRQHSRCGQQKTAIFGTRSRSATAILRSATENLSFQTGKTYRLTAMYLFPNGNVEVADSNIEVGNGKFVVLNPNSAQFR